MRPWLILINDFSHDLFTGLWFGSFVTLIVLRGKVGDPVLLGELNHVFTVLCLSSLIAIMLTGYSVSFTTATGTVPKWSPSRSVC